MLDYVSLCKNLIARIFFIYIDFSFQKNFISLRKFCMHVRKYGEHNTECGDLVFVLYFEVIDDGGWKFFKSDYGIY